MSVRIVRIIVLDSTNSWTVEKMKRTIANNKGFLLASSTVHVPVPASSGATPTSKVRGWNTARTQSKARVMDGNGSDAKIQFEVSAIESFVGRYICRCNRYYTAR